MTELPKVPHLSYPQLPKHVLRAVDETPFTHTTEGRDGISRTFHYRRAAWRYGGYVTFAACGDCGQLHEAGGRAGEEALRLWQKQQHTCDRTEDATFDLDENEAQMFRT